MTEMGLGFTSDWMGKWRETFKPITKFSYAIERKKKYSRQMHVTSDKGRGVGECWFS